MRARLHYLPVLLALFALGLLAAWPALRAGPPTVGDGYNHFFRLAELHWALQHGNLYPRWLPDVAFGFGLPVFNFYPPLTYWLAEIWALAGASLPHAMQAGYLLACLTLVVGAFVWARDVFASTVAGLGAAAAYSLAPYLFLNLIHRAAYPETWGLALAPWLFWAALRLSRQPDSRRAVILALVAAALILSHALSTLMLLPLALLYLAALIHLDKRAWAWAALGLLLATGLSALFWLPVLQEARFIQLSRVGGGMLDFRNNFPSPAALFSPPRVFDPLRTFNEVPPSVNWIAFTLAAVGAWLHRNNSTVRLAALGALLLTGLTLPVSAPLWDALPLLRFVQFPWRWVGPLSLLLALLAGGGIEAIGRGPTRIASDGKIRVRPRSSASQKPLAPAVILAMFVLASAAFALTWTFGSEPGDLTGRDHAGIPAFELDSGQFGTTATGEYLSVWAVQMPDPATLADFYARRDLPPQRLDRAALPAEVQVLREAPGFDHTVIEYDAPAPFDARLFWLFFPDVQAEVEGGQPRIGPEPETGLVQVTDLPAGRRTVTIRRTLSRPQRLGTAISMFSALVLIGLSLILNRKGGDVRQVANLSYTPHAGIAVALAAGAILVLRVTWLDVRPSIFHHTQLEGQVVSGTEPRDVNFGGKLNLIGLQVHDQTVRLYWRPLAKLDTDYSVALFLQDEAGFIYGQRDSQHPGPVPTSRWQLGQYAEDTHELAPLPGTPPGEYQLVVGVYSEAGTLEVETPSGPAGHYTPVGTMTVPPASRPPTLEELAPQVVSGAPFGNFTLLGYDIDRPAVVAGGAFYVTLYWEAAEAAPPGTLAELTLQRGEQTLAHMVAPMTRHTVPWQPGEVARGPQVVPVPADTPPGVGVIVLRAGDIELELGEIEVTVP